MQEYSNSKCDFDNIFYNEQEMWDNIARRTPSNSSWDPYCRLGASSYTYEEARQVIKSHVNTQYSLHSDTHIVVYAETCSDEDGTYYKIYMLR